MKIGLVGCGRMVEEAHVPALLSLDDMYEVAALADPSSGRRATIAALLPKSRPAGYETWHAMLQAESLDAVVVAVPHDLHEAAITDAARAGVNIISEKPLAASLEAIDRIASAVSDAGVRLSVMHNWRFNPETTAAIDAVAQSRIGTPFLLRNERVWGAPWASRDPSNPDWRLSRARSGGGIVIDGAYHDFYLAEREIGRPVERVFASLGTFGAGSDVEDTATIVLNHVGGATSVIQRSWMARGGGKGIHEIHGTEGSIRFRELEPDLLDRIFRGDYAGLPEAEGPPVEIFENSIGAWQPLVLNEEPTAWWDGVREVFRQTSHAWGANRDAPVGIDEARHALAVVEAAYMSAGEARTVPLEEMEHAHRHSVLS